MFHTLTNVQTGTAVPLLEPIDNREGKLCVGLRSLDYWVGWHNVHAGAFFQTPDTTVEVAPGFYSFDALAKILKRSLVNIRLEVSHATGLARVVVPERTRLAISDDIRKLLGLNLSSFILDKSGSPHPPLPGVPGRPHPERSEWLRPGTYDGDKPVGFAIAGLTLHVHLEQLSTTHNVKDGAPSNILAVVPITSQMFGEAAHYHSYPEFRRLQTGLITELKLNITDSRGNNIDNHDMPISVVLEIK